MTPCYICGRAINDVRLDARDKKTRPCLVCEGVIADSVRSYDRDRREEEDEQFMHLSLDEYLATKRTYDVNE